jgi:hypothetical protein
MKRNENATCGNCPYWGVLPKSKCGMCRLYPADLEKLNVEWCGKHPEFWMPVEATVTSIPTIWPDQTTIYPEGTE